MPTPKTLRAAPPRYMHNYTVSMRKFQDQDPQTDPDNSYLNFLDDGISNYVLSNNWNHDIGFAVEINGKSYTKFGVFPGIVVLQDPNEASPDYGNYIDPGGDFFDNDLIKPSFDDDHILLCPWFDIQVYTSSTPENLQAGYEYNTVITTDILQRLKEGREFSSSYDWPYDSYDRGIRYKNGNDTRKGRYLSVRFNSYTYGEQYPRRLKYDVVLYENGAIEFKYWRPKTYADTGISTTDTPAATCGIFWSGPSNGSDKFRDFAPLLDYGPSTRTLSEFGGAIYDVGYSESGAPYSNQLNYNNWPKNGAVISFSPPVSAMKYLPQQIVKDTTTARPVMSSVGMFDDRRSTIFGLTTSSAYPVNMPSTLSTRLLEDTNPNVDAAFRQHLFTSGGLLVESGTQSKAVIDDMLNQIDLFAASRTSRDLSFNESSKPALGPVVNDFYSTGTPELADRSLEMSLQSKVHFHMSLPITKPILMPSSSASLYYYDIGKTSWDYVGGDAGFDSVAPARYYVSGGLDTSVNNRLLAVIENGRGFDAVGRKIVSGGLFQSSLVTSRNYLQKTAGIGSLFNTASFEPDERADQLISTTYGGSITDAQKYFPTTSQTISFNTDQPFLIEKIVAKIPIYASGSWFNDVTTVNKAFGPISSPVAGFASGAIDFGGPALTFAIHCPRRSPGTSYMDLIASGTITHNFDDVSGIKFYKEPGMAYTCLRPIGFRSFSQPTAVVSGTWNGSFHEFSGHVTLEMTAAVHGGISFVRNDIASGSIAKERAIGLLTSQSLPLTSGRTYDYVQNNDYTRVHVQQVSPLSRGTSKFEFNGNSVVGRSAAAFNLEGVIPNPVFVGSSGSLSVVTKSTLDVLSGALDAVMQYSTVDNLVSPYMIFPGDKLTFSVSKTRPVIYQANHLGVIAPTQYGDSFGQYALTGSHNGVVLNTGSIDITFYGSYIKEGIGYVP